MEESGRRLILADGTRIENGEAGYYDGFLWLKLPGMTMAEAATIVFNPAKTRTIWFQYGEMEEEYKGFTNCTAMLAEDGQISASLVKGA